LLVTALIKEDGPLRRFIDMINKAKNTQAPAPSAYAEFTNTPLWRPLELVNMGWSLELVTNEWESHWEGDKNPMKWLLQGKNEDGTEREYYELPLKFGDNDRAFDGLG